MPSEKLPAGLLAHAVKLATPTLEKGERLAPLLIIERSDDRDVERFDGEGISEAKVRLAELLRASGRQICVLAYQGRIGHAEPAILMEGGRAGEPSVKVYAQRFRPHKGRFRGFKLIGEPTRVGITESAPV